MTAIPGHSENRHVDPPTAAPDAGDWAEPGAYPVAAGVHRIPLQLPLNGLRAVNMYVIDADDGLALIDPGWATPETGRALSAGLSLLGRQLTDVRRIYVTHAHHDHYTQALALREQWRVEVFLGAGERPTVATLTASPRPPAPQTAMLVRAGAATLAARFEPFMSELDARDPGPVGWPDLWLADGDRLDIGTRSLEVIATPGHTRGHVVFRDGAAGILFSGDHVLPHITPSIGYERAPEPAPLRSYLDSLRLTRSTPDTLLAPAHGPVAPSVHARVEQLLEHHRQRLDEVLTLVAGGARTAWDVASAMTWTRKMLPLQTLEDEHGALAVLEVSAHLEVLRLADLVSVSIREGVDEYCAR